jgi:DNA-binding response OmpR family regulator
MKKLYYIEQVTFLRDMVESLCKQSADFECYTTSEGQNSLYFFQDMTPDFILIDWATISSYQEDLLKELSEVSSTSVGLTCEPGTLIPEEWTNRANIVLEKPIVAKSLLKKIFS